jgi:hypothetical protein
MFHFHYKCEPTIYWYKCILFVYLQTCKTVACYSNILSLDKAENLNLTYYYDRNYISAHFSQ